MTTTHDIPALRALLEKATKGPFYTTGAPWFTSGSGVLAGSPDGHIGYVIADCEQWEGEREEYVENDGPVKIASGDDDAALIAAALNALPALLDAAEERDRLRKFTKPLGTERRGDRVSERDELIQIVASFIDSPNVIQIVASFIDSPNVYMGGQSQESIRKAGHIIGVIAAFYERRALNHR